MHVVIFAKGGKQFWRLNEEVSLLVQSVQSFLKIVESDHLLIVTQAMYVDQIQAELQAALVSDISILTTEENDDLNLDWTARYLKDKFVSDAKDIIVISPADLLFLDPELLRNALMEAASVVRQGGVAQIGQNHSITVFSLQRYSESELGTNSDKVIALNYKFPALRTWEDIFAVLPNASRYPIMYRPWGSYQIIGESQGYTMKKIIVEPGQKLSLQLHHYRSEHWVVISGQACVTVGEAEKTLLESQSVFIPVLTKHRLENRGQKVLEIVEVQHGDYLGEDDIVRFEDIYGRL